MEIRVHRPYIVLKDRPYSEEDIKIDLGEIIITSNEFEEAGRIRRSQFKKILMTKFIIEASDLGIRYSKNDFEVAKAFDMKVDFQMLNHSNELGKIDSKELDKSYFVTLELKPQIILNMT